MSKTFSIILPVYNQSLQIEKIIAIYTKGLNRLKTSYEILLIVNGGDINSYKIAKKITKDKNNIRTFYISEAGWGRAVRHGLQKADGKYICYTNSARTNVDDLVTILKLSLANPRTVIKATRILRAGFIRKIGSTLYNIECRLLLKVSVWDVNGTPKVLPRYAIKKIALKSNDDLIDAELVGKCMHFGIPIIEVPVRFPPRYAGKSTTNYLSAIKMYLGVNRVRKLIYR